jgi:hypothetical protein
LKQKWVSRKEILKGNKQHLKHVLLKAGTKYVTEDLCPTAQDIGIPV